MKVIHAGKPLIDYGEIGRAETFRISGSPEIYMNVNFSEQNGKLIRYACELSTGKLVKIDNDTKCVMVEGAFVEGAK